MPNNNYEITPVTREDLELILYMRNKEYVRKSMIDQRSISSDDHKKWFTGMLRDKTKAYFIFNINKVPAGVIGFYNLSRDSFANWSFYLGVDNTPKGAGTNMCQLGLENLFKNTDALGIRTMILNNNHASIKIHKKLGFSKRNTECENGQSQFELTREAWIDRN